jgi:hypothetical protein
MKFSIFGMESFLTQMNSTEIKLNFLIGSNLIEPLGNIRMSLSEIITKNKSKLIYKDSEIKNIDAGNFFSN